MLPILRQSWHQSLAAAAIVSAFGTASAPANGAPMPDGPVFGLAYEPVAQKEKEEPIKEELEKHSQAIAEKLEQLSKRIRELEESGDLLDAKKLSAQRDELKAILEERKVAAKVRLKEDKKTDATEQRKKAGPDSIEALRDRLKQLENENAKLRDALEGSKKRIGKGAEPWHQDLEHAKKELMHLQQKLSTEKEEQERAKLVLEKMARELDRAEAGQEGITQQKEALAKKWKQLAEEKEKLKEKEPLREKRIAEETRTLEGVAEKLARVKGDPERQELASTQVQELGAMLKQLREEVGRLRKEVAELRHAVKEASDSKESKRPLP